MTAQKLAHHLEKVHHAQEASRVVNELLEARYAAESGLLEQINADHQAGKLTATELLEIYVEWREITRTVRLTSWTAAGLMHPNSLRAAAKKEHQNAQPQ